MEKKREHLREEKIYQINNEQDSINRQSNHVYQLQQIPNLTSHFNYDFSDYVLKKNYFDYNLCQLFTITPNDDYLDQPFYEHLQIKNDNEPFIKNEYQFEQHTNSNRMIIHPFWSQNHQYFDHQDIDIKKQEVEEKIDHKSITVKGQPFDQEISHYILSNDHGQSLLRLKSNEKLKGIKEQQIQLQNQFQIQKQRDQKNRLKLVRKQKVRRYLEKKQKRCFMKKITYQCRKLVADKRIRLKGRFINYNQAISQLGLNPHNNYHLSQLKQLIKQLETSNTQTI